MDNDILTDPLDPIPPLLPRRSFDDSISFCRGARLSRHVRTPLEDYLRTLGFGVLLMVVFVIGGNWVVQRLIEK